MQHRSAPFSHRWLVRWRTAVWQRPGPMGLVLQVLGVLVGENAKNAAVQIGLMLQVLGVLALTFGLGYLYLGDGYIYYRVPVSHFNPNAQVGKASFAVLKSELIQRQCFPGCIRPDPDLMLIQTSATSFEEIVAYSRRLASPNDNDLAALFVRDTVPGQPWKEFARGRFPYYGKIKVVPDNCVAILYIGANGNPDRPSQLTNRTHLFNFHTRRNEQEFECFETRTSYYSDSLIEIRWHNIGASKTFKKKVTSCVARTITPTDATFHSPCRAILRRRMQTQNDSLLR